MNCHIGNNGHVVVGAGLLDGGTDFRHETAEVDKHGCLAGDPVSREGLNLWEQLDHIVAQPDALYCVTNGVS